MKVATYIKLDKHTKSRAQKLASDLGFTLTAVINAQLKQFIRDKGLRVGKTQQMSPALEKKLSAILSDIEQNENLSPPISSKEDLKKYLNDGWDGDHTA